MAHNILLLQGPVGPFFRRFARDLEKAGARVFKINFNGGDRLFFHGERCFDFDLPKDQWPLWLEKKITELNIDTIYLFGDCRHYHAVAREIAPRLGVEVYVFEEGYLRPNYITLERNGVNGHSGIVRQAEKYRRGKRLEKPETHLRGSSFFHAALYAMAYYLAAAAQSGKFPHYEHHRPLKPVPEGLKWLRAGWRKIAYKVTERKYRRLLLGTQPPDFYLVALQVHSDMQIRAHSSYDSIEAFIADCIRSFANNAPAETLLVIKHHPMDRGYTDYSRAIRSIARQNGIAQRVIYIHDLNLPQLLRNTLGLVTVNSTVGLSALLHGKPVKAMGNAIYDMPGLTTQKPLDEFWQAPTRVDIDLFERFRAWLHRNNQIKGNFYRRVTASGYHSGMILPELLKETVFKSHRQADNNADTTINDASQKEIRRVNFETIDTSPRQCRLYQ